MRCGLGTVYGSVSAVRHAYRALAQPEPKPARDLRVAQIGWALMYRGPLCGARVGR
jgi:hypothetical protein